MLKKDNLVLGIVLGLLTPVVGCILYLFILMLYNNYATHTEGNFLHFISGIFNGKKYSAVISISAFANLPWFNYYIKNEKMFTVRGIVLATVFYSLLVVLFIWI